LRTGSLTMTKGKLCADFAAAQSQERNSRGQEDVLLTEFLFFVQIKELREENHRLRVKTNKVIHLYYDAHSRLKEATVKCIDLQKRNERLESDFKDMETKVQLEILFTYDLQLAVELCYHTLVDLLCYVTLLVMLHMFFVVSLVKWLVSPFLFLYARPSIRQRRAFSVALPSTWNGLPIHSRLLLRFPTDTFYGNLKTALFGRGWVGSVSE